MSKSRPNRVLADLAQYPDLVVIYLGMRVNSPRGLKTLMKFAPPLMNKALTPTPDGLLLHENLTYSLLPPHAGFRQYWRDFDSLERWARSGIHREWWKRFLANPAGTGFWHETYARGRDIESMYIDMPGFGLGKFAPTVQARGSMFSARQRVGVPGSSELTPGVAEEELYGDAKT
ncbi:MAG TPA: DUF4188 domain-containing protein [Actinomycetota bacterium]|nr:DUF4188 domain-containing protein [Actinomycetota bacterium]